MDQFEREILEEFIIEANELLGVAEEDILEIEDSRDQELINRIFRAFHTVKGNAAMIGMEGPASLAHEAENILTKVRSGLLTPDKQMVDILLNVIDALKQLLDDARADVKSSVNVKGLMDDLIAIEKKADQNNKLLDAFNPSQGNPSKISVFTDKTGNAPDNSENKRALKILAAEDDETSRRIIGLMLQQYGEVFIVDNGKKAVEAVKETFHAADLYLYDLICMDIMMPELNGMEAVKQIREIEKENGIQLANESIIIMTTALDDPKTVIRSLYKSGATSYLVKPVQKSDLEKELKKQSLI
jgi:two-component system chemotaxis response regulator CheY